MKKNVKNLITWSPSHLITSKRQAFTLAEVLITLAIIGVVAAMTIPTLVANHNAKLFKTRKEVAEAKIREITRQMNIHDALAPHTNTSAFVDTLKDYVKIAQVCDSENLTDCFSEQITKSTGEIIEVKNLKNSSKLGTTYNDTNLAFKMLDGLTYIMSYDNSCVAPDKYNSALSTTECLSYVLDVNGQKGPNKIGEDIVLVNASLPGGGCDGIEFNDLCIASEDIDYSCNNTGSCDTMGDPTCDCQAAANVACQAIGMRAPNAREYIQMYLHREELGNPATAITGVMMNPDVEVPDNYEEMLASDEYQQQMEAASDEEMQYAGMLNYVWAYQAGYNKVRCVK